MQVDFFKIVKSVGIIFTLLFLLIHCGKEENNPVIPEEPDPDKPEESIALKNLEKAIHLADMAFEHYIVGDKMAMATSYNPFTQQRAGTFTGVWEYTSVLEAVNAILSALEAHSEKGNTDLYETHYDRYADLLDQLFDNLGYYKGSFELTSFTQTKTWSVYAVSRSETKGGANVEGRQNVYDDQLWLIIELMKSHRLTNDTRFLQEAEYLMQYVLDGWDATPDASGKEHGGIPWGPGYVTKHAASNGPSVSPLVWLYEYYKDKDDETVYRYINEDKTRASVQMKKSEYYLSFAEKIYAWSKDNLLLDNGLYADMMGGCEVCDVQYENIGGNVYRAHTPLKEAHGGEYSYNSGSMISAASDLYRVTGTLAYMVDLQKLCTDAFSFFAKPVEGKTGYYDYDDSKSARILLYGYLDARPYYAQTEGYIDSFQKSLDYAYENYLQDATLPVDLLAGWNDDKDINGIYQFSSAAEYAYLSTLKLQKEK